MKKVLFIVSALDVGGIENYLLRFIQYSKGKVLPTVICRSARKGELDEKYKDEGAKVILFKLSYFSPIDYIKLYKFLKNNKFDAVCDFGGDFAGLVLTTSYLAKIPKRITFYRNAKYKFKNTKLKKIYAKTMNKLTFVYSTKILSNSTSALKNFYSNYNINDKKFLVIRNGIPPYQKIDFQKRNELRKELGIPNNSFLIGHIGRYDHQKNHTQILNIANALISSNKNIYFFLCGKDVKDKLETKINSLKLEDNIIISNARSDVWDLLQSFDAFYFPSTIEGQPNALLEAMSTGLPFVASNINPIKETVAEKFHRYLVKPNDSKHSLELLNEIILSKESFPSEDVSRWTQETYNSKKLFLEFFEEL